jgi:hypothetical protein
MTRGQAYTLEGVFASLLILMSAMFGMQVVGTTEPGGMGGPEALETQLQDLLVTASQSGALSEAVRCYDDQSKPLITGNGQELGKDPAEFELMLNRILDSQGRSYNLYFEYTGSSGRERELVSATTSSATSNPDDDAVSATQTVTLYDDMQIAFGSPGVKDCSRRGPELAAVNSFYAPDAADSPGEQLYNIVEVRLVAW